MTAQQAASRVAGFNTQVQWRDFRRIPHPVAPRDAHIETRHSLQTGTAHLTGGFYRLTNLRASVSVHKPGMWVRSTWLQHATPAEKVRLLRHEQGHFDLLRLIIRDLVREIGSLEWSDITVSSLANVGSSGAAQLQWAHNRILKDAASAIQEANDLMRELGGNAAVDGLYDQDTNHGTRTARQDIWNQVFDRCLRTGESLTGLLWAFGIRSTL